MGDNAKVSKANNVRKNIIKFFKDMKNELKKVVWPNRTQLTNNTLTVLISCFVVGALIWLVDWGLLWATGKIFVGR